VTENNGPVERRRHPRFQAPIGAFVEVWTHPTRLGEIIDISIGGLAFRYLATKKPSNGSHKLNIFLDEKGFRLNDVPFETVTDFGIGQTHVPSVTVRQSGVQFGQLTDQQISQLENFIQNHTAGEV
jgi:hypothetical protein